MSKKLPPTTEQKVFAAIETLLADGEAVSVRNIRSALARAHPSLEFRVISTQVQQHLSKYYQQNGGKND